MRKLAVLILLSALVFAAAPLAAGTIVTVQTRDLPDGTPEATLINVDGERVAITGAGDRMIFRPDQQKMLIVDDAKKTYMAIDAAMMQGISSQVSAASAEIEAAISQLPPEQQAMARRAMQGQMPPPQAQRGTRASEAAGATAADTREVRRTNETATKEGYSCVKYEVFDSGKKVRELWVTDWANVQGQADLAAAMASMDEFLSQLTSALGSLGTAAASTGSASVAQWWHGIDGMPVVTTEFKNDSAVEESVVRSVESSNIDGATFEVPEDYKQTTIGG